MRNLSVPVTDGPRGDINEATDQAGRSGRSRFQFMEGYLVLTGFYLVLTLSLSLVLRWYEGRIRIPGH